MTVAFTICSNNYLAYAKTLADSYIKYHPEHLFIIGLVDKFIKEFDYSPLKAYPIIEAESLKIDEFNELLEKYNIMELNTAVKPSFFHYIFNTYKADKVIYLDPDILVKNELKEALTLLDEKNIVLTPHLLKPIDDGFTLNDFQLLRDGIFNLGFIGLSNYSTIINFLDFWHQRVFKYGFGRSTSGMFYDQLWVNYVPALYDNYAIIKHPGYNMANWNLHERVLSENENGDLIVNNNMALCFFHFSGYKYKQPELISSYSNRFNLSQRNDLKRLFNDYRNLLIDNNIENISKLPVYYFPFKPAASKFDKVKKRIKASINVLIYGHQ
jgi:hypothetical protein